VDALVAQVVEVTGSDLAPEVKSRYVVLSGRCWPGSMNQL